MRVLEPEPGAGRLAGIQVAVNPNGSPLTANVTGELKPLVTVTVRVTDVLAPCATVMLEAEAAAYSEGRLALCQC